MTKERGPALGDGSTALLTVHPAYPMRFADGAVRAVEPDRIVVGLKRAKALL